MIINHNQSTLLSISFDPFPLLATTSMHMAYSTPALRRQMFCNLVIQNHPARVSWLCKNATSHDCQVYNQMVKTLRSCLHEILRVWAWKFSPLFFCLREIS